MVWEWVRDGAGGRKNASGQDGGRRNEKRQPVICVHCGEAVMLRRFLHIFNSKIKFLP
jgi:hypothetical protein